jgi:hypothetical protein
MLLEILVAIFVSPRWSGFTGDRERIRQSRDKPCRMHFCCAFAQFAAQVTHFVATGAYDSSASTSGVTMASNERIIEIARAISVRGKK